MTDIDPLSILAVLGTAADAELPSRYPGLGEILVVVAGILFFLLLNAFFVASEFAIVKVRESQLHTDELGLKRAKRLKVARGIVKHLDTYLSATQVGITLASLALGFLGEPLVMKLLAPTLKMFGVFSETTVRVVSLVSAYALFTFFHVVFGELVPKSVAIRYPLTTTMIVTPPLYAFHVAFKWVIDSFNFSANFVLKHFLRINPDEVSHAVHSADELVHLVSESERSQQVTETEAEISKNALELNDMRVKDILTPRSEVDLMDITAPYEKNWELARSSRHTRFPLTEGDHLDQVKGWVHVKDLLKLVGKPNPDLMSVKRELKVVPDSMPLDTLLTYFLKEHVHFALVVDEFGDTIGLVFLDDILEQIVGDDIQDEFDHDEVKEFVKTGKGEYIVNGTINLYDLEDYLPDLDLECPGITTLGGYIINQLSHIPEEGEELDIDNYTVRVTGTDGRRITQVKLTDNEPEENGDEA